MMKNLILFCLLLGIVACNVNGQKKDADKVAKPVMQSVSDTSKVVRTEAEWKEILTPEQYRVLRGKGTDRAFTGKYYLHHENGKYVCAACGNELFTSDMKFDSECGWPSFDREIAGGKIITKKDTSFGMVRTEIMCARCGSHLGHLFDDGPTVTGNRYCVNSTSINFAPAPKAQKTEEKKKPE